MALTAEQIAKQAGVSVATVSRVLNNSGRVSDDARQAVLEAIRASGAMPRLRGKRTGRRLKERAGAGGVVEIVLVRSMPMEMLEVRSGEYDVGAVGSLTIDRFFAPNSRYANSYYRRLVEGAVEELKRYGLRPHLRITNTLIGQQLAAQINAPAVKGLIILGDYDANTEPFLASVRCPVVALTTWEHQGWPDYVGIRNGRGIRLGFEHLRSLGHSKIGYVAGTQISAVFRERFAAYRKLMAEAGLPYRAEWVAEGSNHIGEMYNQMLPILRLKDRPTAMLCSYDGAALAVHQAAERLGLSIPRQLSVVGFDDDEVGQLCQPPLTTVRVPAQLMGRRAVQLLVLRKEGYEDDRSDGFSVRVMPELVVRHTTAAPEP